MALIMNFNYFKLLILNLSCVLSLSGFADSRVQGFVTGSFLGEAYGGPKEFQEKSRLELSHHPSAQEWENYSRTLILGDYPFPPSDYGHWDEQGHRGSLTDETRHKIVYLNSVKNNISLAESIVEFSKKGSRWNRWLDEYSKSARWVMGERDLHLALPPERMWGGLPTVSGQMIFLFEAIKHIQNPEKGYLKVWELNWIDPAQGKDMTSSIVALSSLFLKGQSFQKALHEVVAIDPFDFKSVPYVTRRMSQYIELALKLSKEAAGDPHKLFDLFESRLNAVYWWEDYVPFVISIALMDFIGNKYPLAALKLAIDFGHDTDSVGQLLGAWIGAIHGIEVFDSKDVATVDAQLQLEYDHRISNFF